MNDRKSKSSTHLLKRLVAEEVSQHVRRIAFATLAMIVVAGTTAGNAYLMQPVLDQIFFEKDKTMLAVLPALIVALAIAGGFCNYVQTVQMRFVGQRIVANLQIRLFDHLMHADLGMFNDQTSGRLISRFTNDIQLMRNSVSTVLTGIAKELLTLIFLLGVMVYQSVIMTLFAVVIFPLAIYPMIRFGKRMRKVADGTQVQLGEFTTQLDETFRGVRVVKAYGQESNEVARAARTIERLFHYYMKASRIQAGVSPFMEALGAVGIAGVIYYGGTEVINGGTTPGAFFSFMAAMIMAYKPIRTVAGLNTNLQEGMAAAARLYEVLDTPARIHDRDDARELNVSHGRILFQDVTFRYNPNAPAVEGITLDIPAGKVAALVGPSGGGKSTIMNLLMRFYDPDEGRILIDGQTIRNVSLRSLRGSMALVSQDIMLFDDTVAANIAYGVPNAGEEDIVAAAEAAAAHEFIMAMPEGYHTRVGPSGVMLSGGQRQRIAIARAMLKNAPILLLDEATSALDAHSEQAVQQALEELMQARTTLVIAHRLSTIQHADVIYVMDQGLLVEKGTHQGLLDRQGLYAELYYTQFRR